jgi:hypothetical protein
MMSSIRNFILSFVAFSLVASSFVFAKPKAAPKVPPKGSPVGSRQEGDFVIEKRSDGSTVKYKKKTSYDFEGANVEGIYNKPSGSYISNIKDVKARSIIRIRENFDSEVIDSARSVK